MSTSDSKPICYIVAGANGSGKTTFANAFLPNEGNCINFVNADLIAAGLSPFNPEGVAIEAGKLLLNKIENLVSRRESFAFETTLSGLNYVKRINAWKAKGYEVVLFFLKLPNCSMAIERVKLRVSEGGHNIPEKTIERRYKKGWDNFNHTYKPLVDSWVVFDNSSGVPIVIEESE